MHHHKIIHSFLQLYPFFLPYYPLQILPQVFYLFVHHCNRVQVRLIYPGIVVCSLEKYVICQILFVIYVYPVCSVFHVLLQHVLEIKHKVL